MFYYEGVLYRQINAEYRPIYEKAVDAALHEELIRDGLLVGHDEVAINMFPRGRLPGDPYKVLRPQKIPFISYPYEWSFSQLKDAALLTLTLQKRVLVEGFSLSDASAYNVQFLNSRPVFIDTLSLEEYTEGAPWVAYRQFCQHFLAPLALMSLSDIRLGQLLRCYIDGVPLDLAARLLPKRSLLRLNIAMHIFLHARSQSRHRHTTTTGTPKQGRISKRSLLALLQSLESCIQALSWKPKDSEWADYYQSNNNYSDSGIENKEALVGELMSKIQVNTVWDLGANTGRFSRIAARHAETVIAWDADVACVEGNYIATRASGGSILPLYVDLANPSPGTGWAHTERESFVERGPAGCVLALGLIHHLRISNNTPLTRIADFLAGIGTYLIIEFVPKSDSQVRKLLRTREDIFSDYTQDEFLGAFQSRFTLIEARPIADTDRSIYLFRRIER